MTEQEINEAIAEHCGKKELVPHYSHDLNSIREALSYLSEVEMNRYADEVCDLAYDGSRDTDIKQLLTMKAGDLACCYVRAIKKWKETA